MKAKRREEQTITKIAKIISFKLDLFNPSCEARLKPTRFISASSDVKAGRGPIPPYTNGRYLQVYSLSEIHTMNFWSYGNPI